MTHALIVATRRRWAVVAVLSSLSMLTIVDRVSISAAKPEMAHDLGLTDLTFGLIFGAFALGYALFQIPAGYLADRFGPRALVAAVVGLWSVFTALTAVMSQAGLLVAIRFLFGAAEAGAFPASARAIRSWLPAGETGIAQGLLFSGSRLGAAFGLTLTSWSVAALGWRSSFFALGAIGIAWMAGWLLFFRNTPEESGGVSEQERLYIRTGRDGAREAITQDWKSVFRLHETPALLAQYFASNFTFFLCFSWLLPYLREQYHLSATEAGLFAAVPLYFGTAANWASGAIVDALYRRNWGRQSRILPAVAGFLLGAAALVGAIHTATVWGAVACFAVATFGVDLTLSPSWTLCIDIAGPRTGTLSGAMNMCGNIGSFASSVAFPLLLRWTGGAAAYFYCAAAINVLAALLWVGMRDRAVRQCNREGSVT
jgi:MFS transporter, ACS family, glucarate transporter